MVLLRSHLEERLKLNTRLCSGSVPAGIPDSRFCAVTLIVVVDRQLLYIHLKWNFRTSALSLEAQNRVGHHFGLFSVGQFSVGQGTVAGRLTSAGTPVAARPSQTSGNLVHVIC
jgi:hypothetical protein